MLFLLNDLWEHLEKVYYFDPDLGLLANSAMILLTSYGADHVTDISFP